MSEFVFGSSVVKATSGRFGASHIDFLASINPDTGMNRYQLTKQGTGSGNVIQSVCEVPDIHALYSLHVTGSPDEKSVINKYAMDGSRALTSHRWTKTLNDEVGHQAISPEHTETGIKYWSSVNDNITDAENKVVRYDIVDDPVDSENLLIQNAEYYTVFPGNNGEGSTSPTISSDGSLLIVEIKVDDNTNAFRVFLLRDLIDGGAGDYSAGYHLFEFTVSSGLTSSDHPLQGMACDGQYIYMVAGFGDTAIGKRLAKYTLDGQLVGYTANLTVGKSDALNDGSGAHYEPEGLYITRQGGRDMLALVVASGNSGARTNRVWYLNGDHAVTARGFGEFPSFYSTGANDVGTPDNEVIRFGGVERTTNQDTPTFNERASMNTDGSFTAIGGISTHYDSGWTPVTNNNSYDFTHNLGSNLFVPVVLVRDGSGRVFSYPSGFEASTSNESGMSLYHKSVNVLQIATGNDYIYAYDNTELSGSVTGVATGDIRVLLLKLA